MLTDRQTNKQTAVNTVPRHADWGNYYRY